MKLGTPQNRLLLIIIRVHRYLFAERLGFNPLFNTCILLCKNSFK